MLSTLHTNSASDTVVRLLNMGVEAFNLISALNAVVAQRLVRTICKKCRISDSSVTPDLMIQMGIPAQYVAQVRAYKGKGCQACYYTGMTGRMAVHEVMIIDEQVKNAIVKNLPATQIKRVAMEAGMRTLRQSALNKMVAGVTTALEVTKVTASDDIGVHDTANNQGVA